MLLSVDISNFMTWWLQQVYIILTSAFNIIESIEFMGTNLLDIMIAIIVIGLILRIFLSISKGTGKIGSERIKSEKNI